MIFVYFLRNGILVFIVTLFSFTFVSFSICVPVLQKWNELWFAETLDVEYVGLVEQSEVEV